MDKFHEEMERVKSELGLSPGDIYEDCAFHPVVCVEVNYETDDIWGVSLIDGSYPRSCSLRHCGIRKLTIEEAWKIKTSGPITQEDRDRVAIDKRWW